jgi:preprotein translocase SecE subunit
MNLFSSIVDYLRSAKAELEKVSWPSKADTIRYSALVLGVSIVVAAFFATLDFGLLRLVDSALIARDAGVAPAAAAPTPTTPAITPTLEFGTGTNTIVPVAPTTPSGTAQ